MIGDDVEVGANACIDRGTIRDTAHRRRAPSSTTSSTSATTSTVGRDCLLCGQVGIAGSARIGDRVVLGGQCGVNDNIFVGDDVVAGGGTKIFTNAPAGRVLLGYPAVKMETHVEMHKALRRLPRLAAHGRARLQKAVSKPHRDRLNHAANTRGSGGAVMSQSVQGPRDRHHRRAGGARRDGRAARLRRCESLGIDSLGLVESIFAIEEAFDISVPFNANDPDDSDFDISSVAAIVAAVEKPGRRTARMTA